MAGAERVPATRGDGGRRGPRNDATDRILRAARELFFDDGFVGVTTDRLARAANVSKSTLYGRFGDMAGVLRAVAEAEASTALLSDASPPASADAFRGHLAELGARLLELIEQPEKVRFDRLVLEQARAHPELAQVYYDAIYARTHAQLAELLADAQRRGWTRSDLPARVMADQLLSMWQGLTGAQVRLGLPPTDGRTPSERSHDAVQTLLGH